ncbi:MAG: DUF2807 domain-containing protein [Algoriphagus sp.]|uniref:GIN domain-containing protein n=1 Tax=Algoriphagus sp. TaxID=1872435 RepID=UPI0017C96103|nr:DUF2807 domain-containing protein [Algoriphagus sp.]NVJ85628.1 DUF2807 domain-containing protein [Algoriphagus sp.]
MKTKTTLIFLVALLALACNPRSEKNLGELITETRAISGINELKLDGVFNIYLRQGDDESLEINAYEEVMDYLIISENGSELLIDFDPEQADFLDDKTPEIHLTLSDLNKLTFDGVGNIRTKNQLQLGELTLKGKGVVNLELDFEADRLDADFDMMGNTKLSGKAEVANIQFEGMGNLEASKLITQKMDINSKGMGRVAVHCEGELSITAEGMGMVSYTGNPTILKEEIKGLGGVDRN